MFISFNELSDSSRIWIYRSDRTLTKGETVRVESVMEDFCGQWSAHGSRMLSSYQIQYSQFLILSVDEESGSISGCAIDGSVRVLKALGQELEIDFLDRKKIPFLIDHVIKLYPITELKSLFQSGVLRSDTITFNNLVGTKAEFEEGWRIEAKKSWMAKYLPVNSVSLLISIFFYFCLLLNI